MNKMHLCEATPDSSNQFKINPNFSCSCLLENHTYMNMHLSYSTWRCVKTAVSCWKKKLFTFAGGYKEERETAGRIFSSVSSAQEVWIYYLYRWADMFLITHDTFLQSPPCFYLIISDFS